MTYDPYAYWSERTRAVMNGSAPEEVRKRDVEVDALVPERVEFIKRELSRDRPSRLLDVGCGFGRWSAALSGHYDTYHGVDVVEERVAEARKVYGVQNITFERVTHDRVWRLRPRFDAAFTSNVIQHLPLYVAQRLLQSVGRSMRPGGRLILWENCIDPESSRWAPHMIPKARRHLHAVIPQSNWVVLSPHTHRLTF